MITRSGPHIVILSKVLMILGLSAVGICLKQSFWDEDATFCTLRLLFSSFFLIQLRACCWGSIHMGNRLPLTVRIPFCTDSSSGGKPSEPHLSHMVYLTVLRPAKIKTNPHISKSHQIHIVYCLWFKSQNHEHTLLLTCWFLPHQSEGFPFWKAGSRECFSPVHP